MTTSRKSWRPPSSSRLTSSNHLKEEVKPLTNQRCPWGLLPLEGGKGALEGPGRIRKPVLTTERVLRARVVGLPEMGMRAAGGVYWHQTGVEMVSCVLQIFS